MERGEDLSSFVVGSVPTLYYIPDFITDADQQQLLNNVMIISFQKPSSISILIPIVFSIISCFVILINQGPVSKWKSLKNRRLQNWGGVVHDKGLLAQDWHLVTCIRNIASMFKFYGVYPHSPQVVPLLLTMLYHANVVEACSWEGGVLYGDVMAQYENECNKVACSQGNRDRLSYGDIGAGPHQDGPAYLPVVAILSLGSPVVMDFTPHSSLTLCINTVIKDIEDKFPDGGAGDFETEKRLSGHHAFSVLLMPRSLLIFKDEAYLDYLHGIKDSAVQQYDGVVNAVECLKSHVAIQPLSGPENAFDTKKSGDVQTIHRLENRGIVEFNLGFVRRVEMRSKKKKREQCGRA
ncbi:hypothetical protein RHSIM_Rhsim13G0235500 [Rhododendron simsii]|uniref:Fe2OG dioxygenase domain-containing protein n=1 Tax=Rhododendron simsii TaxID=118357 RepID=A0A834FY79_RHOSS|nr:hypothetical protein RHSIM_Rhsim13G0235500 [Rhododendron simsii]